jgi:hypothetical protein
VRRELRRHALPSGYALSKAPKRWMKAIGPMREAAPAPGLRWRVRGLKRRPPRHRLRRSAHRHSPRAQQPRRHKQQKSRSIAGRRATPGLCCLLTSVRDERQHNALRASACAETAFSRCCVPSAFINEAMAAHEILAYQAATYPRTRRWSFYPYQSAKGSEPVSCKQKPTDTLGIAYLASCTLTRPASAMLSRLAATAV